MAKRNSKSTRSGSSPAKPRANELADALGLTPLEYQLFSQAFGAIWIHPDASSERKLEIMVTAACLITGIKPNDDLERILAAQMVATHNSAMECLKRAALDGQTFEARDMNLKHAAKLLAIYARQMDVLNKHRGKGQQKVTVEHVHVEAGGQAVVGHVNAAPRATPRDPAQKALAHTPGETLDLTPKKRSKTCVKRRGS